MLLDTLIGSDDYHIIGKKGKYIIVQVDDRAYEIVLQNHPNHCRMVGYATSKREAEGKVRRYDAE